MKYCLRITDDALDDLHRLDKHISNRIIRKLRFYVDSNQPLKFAEHLNDFNEGEFRFHIGEHRATFETEYDGSESCVINVLIIDNRKDVYRKNK